MFKRFFFVTGIIIIILRSASFAGSLPLFTQRYERTAGSPNIYTSTVNNCNTSATYSLVVINGQNGEDVISSASITLNGVEVVREKEFNQKMERVEKTITLQSENTLNIKLASGPGGFITVNIFCAANCLGVEITPPAGVVNKPEALIRGTLRNVHGETGVALEGNGVTALSQVQGENFAGIVLLRTGTNTITAIATDACGYKAAGTATINTDAMEEPLRLTVMPSSGVFSPATGALEVAFEADVNIGNPVADYLWDFDGDGVTDAEGGGLSGATFSYRQTGLYFPGVTVTDFHGNAYAGTAVVNVLSRETIDAVLKGKWEGMKGGLAGGDMDKAVRYFATGSRERYREGFTVLKEETAGIFSRPEELGIISVVDGVATYENVVVEDDGNAYSYPVIFILDEDGLWKIQGF